MLILTRKIGEKFIIGEDIEIMLLDIRGHQARIGIKAPKEVNIRREELLYRNREEKHESDDDVVD